MIFDYAKVRAVVEDRRSMLGAPARGEFVRRNLGATIGLYALNSLLFCNRWRLLPWSLLGNAECAALRLVSSISRCALPLECSRRIADRALPEPARNAGYVARPVPAWPDSPAAEALDRNNRYRLSATSGIVRLARAKGVRLFRYSASTPAARRVCRNFSWASIAVARSRGSGSAAHRRDSAANCGRRISPMA